MKIELINIIGTFSEKAEHWMDSLINHLPNLTLAIIIFFLGFYAARFFKGITTRLLRSRQVKPSARNMLGNIVSIIIVLAFFLIALDILNLDNTLKTLLAGAGVAGLAIGLALQGTLSNTFSGVALSFIKDIRIGDQVETNGFVGVIEDINLRVVKLRGIDNNLVSIPNKLIIENPLKNYSSSSISKIIIQCGVAYDSNLEKVKSIVIDTIKNNLPTLDTSSPISFAYNEFADSSINFEVGFYAPSKNLVEIASIKSDGIIAIKKAFDENGINIPFPIRTLDIPGKEWNDKLS